MRPGGLLNRLLAFARTRLLGAVLMPALVGSAWVARTGRFDFFRFLLVIAGLAAAELSNLLAADYAVHLASSTGSTTWGRPTLPGSPVISPRRLPPGSIPLVLAPLGFVGVAVLLYFTLTAGPGVLALAAAAAAIGGLYVLEPFPLSYLATALVPPLVCGGTVLALTGRMEPGGFLAGLPVAWISAGVILGYRWLYPRPPGGGPARTAVVIGCYAAAAVSTVILVLARVLPPAALAAAAVPPVLGVTTAGVLRRQPGDPVPATALGVLGHILSCLALTAGLLV